jgi:hypothetical protein
MKRIVIFETQKQKNYRRATRAVNTPQQYRLTDFQFQIYGVYGR